MVYLNAHYSAIWGFMGNLNPFIADDHYSLLNQRLRRQPMINWRIFIIRQIHIGSQILTHSILQGHFGPQN